jgi:hypothetical protein
MATWAMVVLAMFNTAAMLVFGVTVYYAYPVQPATTALASPAITDSNAPPARHLQLLAVHPSEMAALIVRATFTVVAPTKVHTAAHYLASHVYLDSTVQTIRTVMAIHVQQI